MLSSSPSPVVKYIHQLAGSTAAPNQSDQSLLERFLAQRDEAAFAALVRRYGRLVLSVCRRVLRHEHDAEDAFQATFLVLARRASSIRERAALGSWLYGVAYRVSTKARARGARRRSQFRMLTDDPIRTDRMDSFDIQPVLDEEINRLAEKYRAPIVLCYLEGKTTAEAARQLGCARGTVLSRLARARERLRPRLHRRGLALSALVTASAGARGRSEMMPGGLAWRAVQAATQCSINALSAAGATDNVTQLALEVLRTMGMKKLGPTVLSACATLGLLAGGVAISSRAEVTVQAGPPAPSETRAEDTTSWADQAFDKFQEAWAQVEERMRSGNPWIDKVTFDAAYDELKQTRKPSVEDLQAIYNRVTKTLPARKEDAAYTWRAQQVLGTIQADLKQPAKALEHYQLALKAYPAKTYEDPSKHSYFQHLANQTAGVVWKQQGIDKAERFILDLFRDAPQYQYFFVPWWKEKLDQEGKSDQYQPLLREFVKAYSAKAEKDKDNNDLYRRYQRQLKIELESSL